MGITHKKCILVNFCSQDINFQKGLDYFMEIAIKDSENPGCIRCPCKICKCRHILDSNEAKFHLCKNGFWKMYDSYYFHGEELPVNKEENASKPSTQHDQHDDLDDDIFQLVNDVCDCIGGDDEEHHLDDDVGIKDVSMDDPVYKKLMEHALEPLYVGCKKYSKLSMTAKLYNLKMKDGWSENGFDELLELLADAFPNGNTLPSSAYAAKKVIKSLTLNYEKIHACTNDCILYWDKYANENTCPKCGTSRWKMDPKTNRVKEGVPAKVLRHFPLTKRLKRLYRYINKSG